MNRFVSILTFWAPLVLAQIPVYDVLLEDDVVIGPGNGLSTGLPNDDLAYVTTRDGRVYTISESTGEVINKWVPPVPGICNTTIEWNDLNADRFFGAHAVGNNVYIMSTSGTPLNRQFSIMQGIITGQPIVKGNLVYVPHNDMARNIGYLSIYVPYDDPPARIFSTQTFSGTQIGTLSQESNNYLYFGGNNGLLFYLDIRNKFNPQLGFVGTNGSAINFGQDMRGRPYGDDTRLLIATRAGNLFFWNEPIESQPDLRYNLAQEGSDLGSRVGPLLSQDGSTFYAVAGNRSFAFSRETGASIWSAVGDLKTKQFLNGGNFLYEVESTDGRIIKRSAKEGTAESGYPFSPRCNGGPCGPASGNALLSRDANVVIVAFDDGRLVATQTRNVSPTSAPKPTPSPAPTTPFPTPRAPTSTPVNPDTPGPSRDCGRFGDSCTVGSDCCSNSCRYKPGTLQGECRSRRQLSKLSQKLGADLGGAGGRAKR